MSELITVGGLVYLNTGISIILLYLIIPLAKISGVMEMVRSTLQSHDARILKLEEKC